MSVAVAKQSGRPTKVTRSIKPAATRSAKSAVDAAPRRRARPTPVTASAAPANAGRRRKVIVFGGLVGVMTVTGALLMAMQPEPLSPDAVRSLMAVETSAQVNAVFETQIPVHAGRWRYIYVHHSGSASGNASIVADAPGAAGTLPDHFLIGNGQGAADGEVQIGQRWNAQQPAGKTVGLDRVDSDCISICLVGDLDRSPATPRQLEQLQHLVTALQDRLKISRDRVWVVEAADLPAGCGRYFPREAFRAGLLP